MLLAALLGWLDREQRDVIAYLREENRALQVQLAAVGCDPTIDSAGVWRYWDTTSVAARCTSSPRS